MCPRGLVSADAVLNYHCDTQACLLSVVDLELHTKVCDKNGTNCTHKKPLLKYINM